MQGNCAGPAARLRCVIDADSHAISSTEQLWELFGEPLPRVVAKEMPALDERARAFIASSPFLVMATTGADGSCDAGPKGGPAGFVRVLTDTRLLVPEFPGNRRFDGVQNLVTRPGIGLLFVVPGISETLRVNGFARLTRDPELLEACAGRRRQPWFVADVEVRQVFSHCGKAFIRSHLWQSRDVARPGRDQQPEPVDRRRSPRRSAAANPTCGARSRTPTSPACSTASPPRNTAARTPRATDKERTMTTPYTLKQLTDVEDSAVKFGISEIQEARFADGGSRRRGHGRRLLRVKAGKRQAFGHKHDAGRGGLRRARRLRPRQARRRDRRRPAARRDPRRARRDPLLRGGLRRATSSCSPSAPRHDERRRARPGLVGRLGVGEDPSDRARGDDVLARAHDDDAHA